MLSNTAFIIVHDETNPLNIFYLYYVIFVHFETFMSFASFDSYLLTKICVLSNPNVQFLNVLGRVSKKFARFIYVIYAKLTKRCVLCLQENVCCRSPKLSQNTWRFNFDQNNIYSYCCASLWRCDLCNLLWCHTFKKKRCFDCQHDGLCGLCVIKCRKCNATICNQHRDNICSKKRCNKNKCNKKQSAQLQETTVDESFIIMHKKCQEKGCNANVIYKQIVLKRGVKNKTQKGKIQKYCNICHNKKWKWKRKHKNEKFRLYLV